jgi:rRNA-processing protein FCF1
MEILIAVVLLAIFAETSYLAYRTSQKTTTSKGDILLDTSVLIDGRILAIARSGLVSSRLIITRSVIRELQFMADKADHDKRERARYGLEVIEKLQELPTTTIEIRDDGTTSEHGVDEQLIILAQKSGAKLCTIDYNLNKAARVQAVEIVNINELAHALRVIHLPGERIDVELVQPGQDKKQAVGYLDDGTMVVVDDSREQIGQTVPVELTRVLQTTAGRMMFARRVSSAQTRGEGRMVASGKAQTRGEGRMHANKEKTAKPAVAQTRGEAKGGGRMIAEPSSPQAASPATKSTKPRPQNNQRRGKNRRQSPEDTLVDLANK